jgi:alpha-tubulin suppressor-like RCC1 family protein
MNLYKAYSSMSVQSVFLLEDGSAAIYPMTEGGFPVPSDNVLALAIGAHHNLCLLKDHQLFAWGENDFGQLGLADLQPRTTPTLVPLSTTKVITEIKAGGYFSAALTVEGRLYLWGRNEDGQLGSEAATGSFTASPVEVRLPTLILNFSCGWAHVLAITNDGSLYVWGHNQDGELGLGDCLPINRHSPILHPLKNIISVSGGANCSFFISKSGALLSAGRNENGNVGRDDSQNYDVPQLIFQEGVEAVAAGGDHALALLENGKVYGWGWNLWGQVGTGSTTNVPYPELVKGIWVEDLAEQKTRKPEDEATEGQEASHKEGRLWKLLKIHKKPKQTSIQQPLPSIPVKKTEAKPASTNFSQKYDPQKPFSSLVPSWKLRAVSVGCGWGFSFIVLEDNSLFLWGSAESGAGTDSVFPVLNPKKAMLPKKLGWEDWVSVFTNVILFRRDKRSYFYKLPVEVVWHMIQLIYSFLFKW